jgi:hypothetical protein
MSDAADKAKLAQQEKDAIAAMASAALLVRDAVRASLPVAPEQYLTISIPGTIVDTDNIAQGGTFVYDVDTTPFTPTAVRQAEAKLVDGMMPLGSVMVRRIFKYTDTTNPPRLGILERV